MGWALPCVRGPLRLSAQPGLLSLLDDQPPVLAEEPIQGKGAPHVPCVGDAADKAADADNANLPYVFNTPQDGDEGQKDPGDNSASSASQDAKKYSASSELYAPSWSQGVHGEAPIPSELYVQFLSQCAQEKETTLSVIDAEPNPTGIFEYYEPGDLQPDNHEDKEVVKGPLQSRDGGDEYIFLLAYQKGDSEDKLHFVATHEVKTCIKGDILLSTSNGKQLIDDVTHANSTLPSKQTQSLYIYDPGGHQSSCFTQQICSASHSSTSMLAHQLLYVADCYMLSEDKPDLVRRNVGTNLQITLYVNDTHLTSNSHAGMVGKRLSEEVEGALVDIRKGEKLGHEKLVNLAEKLGLRSNQDILKEASLLENEKNAAHSSKDKGEEELLDLLIILVTQMSNDLAEQKQLQAENGRCPPIPADFRCPLSLELMSDPVIVSSGQTYERAYIQQWLDDGDVTCPKSRQPLNPLNLINNFNVKAMITNWCEQNGVPLSEPKTTQGEGGSMRESGHSLLHARSGSREDVDIRSEGSEVNSVLDNGAILHGPLARYDEMNIADHYCSLWLIGRKCRNVAATNFLIPLRGSNGDHWNDEAANEGVFASKKKTMRRRTAMRLSYLKKDLLDPG